MLSKTLLSALPQRSRAISLPSEHLVVEARPTLKRVRANMNLAAAIVIISRECMYTFERLKCALKNILDEIRRNASLVNEGISLYLFCAFYRQAFVFQSEVDLQFGSCDCWDNLRRRN